MHRDVLSGSVLPAEAPRSRLAPQLGPQKGRHSVDAFDLSLPSPADPAAVCAIIARVLRASGESVVVVPKVRQRSVLLSALSRGGSVRYALSDAGSSAFCRVDEPDALKRLSKEQLRNVDRLRRRAEKEYGAVAIETVTDPGALRDAAFARFVEIEDAGWKGTAGAGTSLAADARVGAFFRDVMHRFGRDGRARIDFLTIGGRDAAAQLMVRAGPAWFLLKIGYHPNFRAVGPGGILLKAFLEEMLATPDIHEVNLTTNPAWAARWHFESEPVYHVALYNADWSGRLRYAGRSLKEVAKAVRDRYQASRAAQTPASTS